MWPSIVNSTFNWTETVALALSSSKPQDTHCAECQAWSVSKADDIPVISVLNDGMCRASFMKVSRSNLILDSRIELHMISKPKTRHGEVPSYLPDPHTSERSSLHCKTAKPLICNHHLGQLRRSGLKRLEALLIYRYKEWVQIHSAVIASMHQVSVCSLEKKKKSMWR